MKKIAFVVLMALVLAVPAYAQLGDTDYSSFTIQNLGTAEASVTVTFYTEAGAASDLDWLLPGPDGDCGTTGDNLPNPFALPIAAKQEINMSFVCGLANNRYSVVVEATEPVAVIANLIGATGTDANPWYNGSYSGFDQGADTIYFPSTVYSFYGWNSLMSVQNTTGADITVEFFIYNENGVEVANPTPYTVPGFSSVHLDLEAEGAGLGLPSLNGSAKAVCSGACVGTDNQTVAGAGYTQSYGAGFGGETTLYAPAVYTGYWSWGASLKVQNVGTGPADIDVIYYVSGGGTCDPAAQLDVPVGASLYHYLPNDWTTWGCDLGGAANKVIAAIVTSDQPIVGVVNHANPTAQSQTYSVFSSGAQNVGLPVIMKNYYGWYTSFTCQNVASAGDAVITYAYDGVAGGCPANPQYPNCQITLGPGEGAEVNQDVDLGTNTGLFAVSVTSVGSPIACIANETLGANQTGTQGDWSMSYNGFGQ